MAFAWKIVTEEDWGDHYDAPVQREYSKEGHMSRAEAEEELQKLLTQPHVICGEVQEYYYY